MASLAREIARPAVEGDSRHRLMRKLVDKAWLLLLGCTLSVFLILEVLRNSHSFFFRARICSVCDGPMSLDIAYLYSAPLVAGVFEWAFTEWGYLSGIQSNFWLFAFTALERVPMIVRLMTLWLSVCLDVHAQSELHFRPSSAILLLLIAGQEPISNIDVKADIAILSHAFSEASLQLKVCFNSSPAFQDGIAQRRCGSRHQQSTTCARSSPKVHESCARVSNRPLSLVHLPFRLLAAGARVIHYSGHGTSDLCLSFENGLGGMQVSVANPTHCSAFPASAARARTALVNIPRSRRRSRVSRWTR